MTYPNPEVARYLGDHFTSYKPYLERREDWPLFRTHHAIWTPTLAFMDRNGSLHYLSPGYLPPAEFLAMARIGRARCLMAWSRWAEAEQELEVVASAGSSFAAEALYWLGANRFLERKTASRDGMWEAWTRLAERYPESPWAKRVYQRSDPA